MDGSDGQRRRVVRDVLVGVLVIYVVRGTDFAGPLALGWAEAHTNFVAFAVIAAAGVGINRERLLKLSRRIVIWSANRFPGHMKDRWEEELLADLAVFTNRPVQALAYSMRVAAAAGRMNYI